MLDHNILLTIILVVGTIITLNVSKYSLQKIGSLKKANEKRIYYVSKSINVVITIVAIFLGAAIWSMSFDGILIFVSSIFAVIGIALFAQWSILSNITSSVIIFFTFPAKVGESIKIVDGDNSVAGKIVEISLFQIHIVNEDGDLIIYPNNLFMQKPIIKINNKKDEDA
ncbi:MAG: mechanosensitive ion channel domain-containing protein [Candidatus Marinarcus sp.]|uniref:mechanosensitive ion channel domain-containing protein n=1 Tax=Candidatus Marinarcus sp. TaxID=3100987 RepID=UPI003AFF9028